MSFASSDYEGQVSLRAALPRAWPALFRRFGRLTEVQARALPELLAGRNVVLASATASGKTEAALAPFAEAATPGAGLQIIHVAPTRALCNDLERRLAGPLRSMGLSFAIRTGEHPDLDLAHPEDVLVTTPESLDSITCRAPRVLAGVHAMILDELHTLDGNYRGDQLRVLVRRIEALRATDAPPVRYSALSATMASPEQMAARYFDSSVVVRAPGMRRLRLELATDLAGALRVFKEHRRRKGIVFCNRRADVERAAQELAKVWPRDRLVVHHASLSQRVREAAESAMRTWPFGLCVATTTLELGLDLGDLDAVILFGAPPTPSGFQQRVGRACRREEEVFAIGCASDDEERLVFERYADLARRGEVEARDYAPDLSVVVQQIFSMTFASASGVELAALVSHLSGLCDAVTLGHIAAHLESEGHIERRPARVLAGRTVMDLGEKGRLHSNIPTTREWRVVDARSGAALGSLLVAAGAGDRLHFAGRAYVVESATGGSLRVRPAAGEARAPSFSRAERGAFTRYLPADLRGRAKEDPDSD